MFHLKSLMFLNSCSIDILSWWAQLLFLDELVNVMGTSATGIFLIGLSHPVDSITMLYHVQPLGEDKRQLFSWNQPKVLSPPVFLSIIFTMLHRMAMKVLDSTAREAFKSKATNTWKKGGQSVRDGLIGTNGTIMKVIVEKRSKVRKEKIFYQFLKKSSRNSQQGYISALRVLPLGADRELISIKVFCVFVILQTKFWF